MKKKLFSILIIVLFFCISCSNSSSPSPSPPPSPIPVVSNFTGIPINGIVPLEVSFNDLSTGNIDSWLWNFGDGNTSTERNPVHVYEFVGHRQTIYTVTLTITDSYGSDIMTKVDYITVNDPGYEYFNPDNAVDIAVNIYTNGEKPFDAMDVPIKNAPLFYRYGVALRNLIIKLIDLGGSGIPSYLYDGFGGYVKYWIYNDDLDMEFHNYYCENENIYLPNIIQSNGFGNIRLSGYDYWDLHSEWANIRLYKNNNIITTGSMTSIDVDIIRSGGVRYSQLQLTDQYIQWYISEGYFEINNSNNELLLTWVDGEPAFFILEIGNTFPSKGCLIVKEHDEMFPDRDSSLKFLIIDSTSFQVFIDTYSDGVYDWDSGIILWSDYYN